MVSHFTCLLAALSVRILTGRTARRQSDLVGCNFSVLRYFVKVFRSNSSPENSVSLSTSYDQKKELLRKTGELHNSVCHEDRKAGSVLAKMMNICKRDLETLGMWNIDVLEQHYTLGVQTAKLVGRMCGFESGKEFYLPRARTDPFTHPAMADHLAMFQAFMPELDDKQLHKILLEEMVTNTHKAGYNAMQALKFIRVVFWQDAPFLFRLYPESVIFKHSLFQEHKESFEAWCEHQFLQESKIDELLQLPPSMPQLSESFDPHQSDSMTKEMMWKGISAVCENTVTLQRQMQLQTDELVRGQHQLQTMMNEVIANNKHKDPPRSADTCEEPVKKKSKITYDMEELPELKGTIHLNNGALIKCVYRDLHSQSPSDVYTELHSWWKELSTSNGAGTKTSR